MAKQTNTRSGEQAYSADQHSMLPSWLTMNSLP